MFELNQLRSFVTIASHMSFRRAAETLNMTQPPLTRQIQLLERDLGIELFDRSGRAIRLTEGGRRFLPEAQDLLRRAEAAALAARSAHIGESGTVSMGFIPVAAFGLLPILIETIRQAQPKVTLDLQEMLTVDQTEALPAGRIDLGIMRPPSNGSQLEIARLVREPYVLALPCNHRLAERKSFKIDDLDGVDLIMYSPSAGWYSYEMLSSLFSRRGIKPRFVQFLGQSITLLSLVDAGEGVALVPESSRRMMFSNIVLRPIELPAYTITEYYLAWKRTPLLEAPVTKVRNALLTKFGVTTVLE